MNYLVDGHNLIGSNLFNDIQLSDEDDEAKLVTRLKIWQSRALKSSGAGKVTVIFDRGIPGGLDVKMGGTGVEVVFAADPAQADDLIRRRLRKAKNDLVLVTNDEALLKEAAAHAVTSWRGEEFVERMKPKLTDRAEAGMETNVQVSSTEVDEWLDLFRARSEANKGLRKNPQLGQQLKPLPNMPAKPVGKNPGKAAPAPQVKPPAKPLANKRAEGGKKGDR
jgi:hypothetical protein